MKYLKLLALVAVAAGALVAFIGAGSASAAVGCSTTVTPCPAGQKFAAGTVLDSSLPSGQSALLVDTSGNTLDTCKESTVKGTLTNAGSSTTNPTGPVEVLTWGGCTFTTTTVEKTKLEVKQIAGTSNGTLFADGTFKVTIKSILGDCIYGVKSGAVLGEGTEGNPGVFHANAVTEEQEPKLAACPDTAKWTGTYNLTSPATTVSVSSS